MQEMLDMEVFWILLGKSIIYDAKKKKKITKRGDRLTKLAAMNERGLVHHSSDFLSLESLITGFKI